jgi:nucleoside-diphosphate-sugar epimerase
MTPAGRRTILVTGGAGYVGSHLVRRLLERGDRVRVLDLLLYGDHGLKGITDHQGLTVLVGDVRDAAAMREAAAGADTVIALAALVGDAACDLDRDATASINQEATEVLTETCVDAGVRRLVFASSCSVYGAGTDPILLESSTVNPVSFYAETRVASERIIDGYADRLSAVTLRLSTVFGLSERMRLDLLVNTFTAHAYFRRKIRVFGGGQWRPNLHVQDAAAAFIMAADARDTLVRGQRFNVGDDRSNHTVREIAAFAAATLPGTEVHVEPQAVDARDYRVSFAKIRKTLGFVQQHSVPDGIAEIAAACRRGEIVGLEDARQSNFESLKQKQLGAAELLTRAA